jgi:hypothetical protein
MQKEFISNKNESKLTTIFLSEHSPRFV